jgi:hypothetical protein
MALVTWIGAIDTAWNTAGNWDTSTVPTTVDSVRFTGANNNPCIVTATTAAVTSIDFTNYAGTITINNGFHLIVAGNVSLSTNSNFIITTPATGTLTMNANGILTSNGRTIDSIFRIINTTGTPTVPTTITIQLADNATMSRGFTGLGSPVNTVVLRSSAPGVKRNFTLENKIGVTQTVDYVNAIDLDGDLGLTIWTYKGDTPVNTDNWYIMSNQPVPTSGFGFS